MTNNNTVFPSAAFYLWAFFIEAGFVVPTFVPTLPSRYLMLKVIAVRPRGNDNTVRGFGCNISCRSINRIFKKYESVSLLH